MISQTPMGVNGERSKSVEQRRRYSPNVSPATEVAAYLFGEARLRGLARHGESWQRPTLESKGAVSTAARGLQHIRRAGAGSAAYL
jgi:hypothetical protein